MSTNDTLPAWGRLRLISGTFTGDQDDKYLTESEHKIGRLPSRADIVLSHVFISGLHCVITLEETEREPAVFRIRDSSRNGVCVNEQFLGPNVEKVMYENDVIHLSQPGKGFPPAVYKFEIFSHALTPELALQRRSSHFAKQNTKKNLSRKRRGGEVISSMSFLSGENSEASNRFTDTSPKRICGSNKPVMPDHERDLKELLLTKQLLTEEVETLKEVCERQRGDLEKEMAKAGMLMCRDREREKELFEKDRCIEKLQDQNTWHTKEIVELNKKLLETQAQNQLILKEMHVYKSKAFAASQQGKTKDSSTKVSRASEQIRVAREMEYGDMLKAIENFATRLKKLQKGDPILAGASNQADLDSSDSSKDVPNHSSEPSQSTHGGSSSETIRQTDEDSLTQNMEEEGPHTKVHIKANSANESEKKDSSPEESAEAVTFQANEDQQNTLEKTVGINRDDDLISNPQASQLAKDSSTKPLVPQPINLHSSHSCGLPDELVSRGEEVVKLGDVTDQGSDTRWLKLDVDTGTMSPHPVKDDGQIYENDTQLSDDVLRH